MEKQYNYRIAEERIRHWWQEQAIYAADLTNPHLISIDTPPPTVSGSLHIGHIFSYTQTDTIARYKRMRGQAIFYPFGFDDNGLPTERFVEKQRALVAHQLSRSQFIQLCLEVTTPVEESFKTLWQQMGLSVDWKQCYTTIGNTARRVSQTSFLRLYEQGFVYRKDEPALYCTTCRTTVAQAELDDEQQATTLFQLCFSSATGQPLVVATTRPELLPACVALVYHPDDVRYQQLQGTQARVPLFDYTVPIYADPQVQPDKGTGLVMCCTFGDTTDIAWYKQHQLPYRPAIGPDGKWLPTTGFLAGKKAKEAREAVVQAAREAQILGMQQELTHAVNVHERCRQPIEFLIRKQWFLKILPYKKELCELADQIHWYPAFMKTRYVNWVENITWDWCLSRQRFFGIPFPVWHCSACQAVLFTGEEQLPVDPQEQPWQGTCTQCGGGPVLADTDVMDTWNTSSLTPYLCEALRTQNVSDLFDAPFTPLGMRPQAHDIIRTWAFYTIVKTWMHHKTIPWRDIVISGHVLSSSGGKLSKSKSNSSLEPEQLLSRFPADAIRFWTTSSSLGHDTAFSEQQLQVGNRLLTKLWNAFRFIAEYTSPQDDTLQQTAPQQLLHRWMLHQLSRTYEQYVLYAERYEMGLALNAVEHCFWKDFCDNYIELVKDQFFNPDRYTSEARAETRRMLRIIGLRFLQLYAPVLVYSTEEVYRELYASPLTPASIHLTTYSAAQQTMHDEQAVEVMELLLSVITTIRRYKTEHQLSLRTEITRLTLLASLPQRTLLEAHEQLLRSATRSTQLIWTMDNTQEPSFVAHADGWHAVLHL